LEAIAGIGLALALGVVIGYPWREHLSRQRRAKYAAEQFERENLLARKRNAAEAAHRAAKGQNKRNATEAAARDPQ